MRSRRQWQRRWRVTAFIIVAALVSPGLARGHSPREKDDVLRKIGPAPEFALTTQDGKRLSLSELRGKVVAVTFIYASCADTCPLLTTKMASLQPRLGADFGSKVFFVPITVDPERDTPEVLKRYAQAHAANTAGWAFVTGTPDEIRAVARRYGIYYGKRPRGDVDHTFLTSLIDQRGTLRVQYLGVRFDPDELLRDLRSLIREGRADAAADAPGGDPARGAALFQQCVACHSVEPGLHLTGPSLAAIWNRRAAAVPGFSRYSEALKHAAITWDAATLDRWLGRPQTVVPETTMTFLGMENARQRADVIAYLKALTEGKAPPVPKGGMMAMGPRSDLKKVGKERRVAAIRHCGDGYHVTTDSGRTVPYWEFNLRFKTDSSPNGPERGKPVLAPQGMQGDRAQVVFSDLDDLKRFLVDRCDESAR